MSPPASAAPTRRPALARRPFFWVAIAVLAGLALPRLLAPPEPARPLPVLARLAAFRLTDQRGRPFGSEDLRGRVWLADFMFTRCPSVCPRLTATMKRVQHRARDARLALQMVSFTIDPTNDTPAALTAYARRWGAARDWTYVTGAYEDLERTIVSGFKVSTGREGEAPAAQRVAIPAARVSEVFHGTHLVLVDAELRVRGYYGSSDADVEDRILADLATLGRERGGRASRTRARR